MNCGHVLIEPNGDCLFCGRLATTMPGNVQEHHVMVPRSMVAKVKAAIAGGGMPCPTNPCAKPATEEDLVRVLTRYEGAVSEVERDGNDAPDEVKNLTDARADLMSLLRQAKVVLEGR